MQGGREKAFAVGVNCPHGSGVTADPNDRPRIRAVLLGGSGLLGGALRQVWAARPEIELVPLSRAELNLTQPDRIEAALEGLEFDLLVNAAAYTRVDDAETAGGRELAMTVNGEAAGRLAVCAAARGTKLLHFSTDYVFDGRKDSPYTETDPTNPLGAYGESKRVGEERVLEASGRHLVVRLSWLCGPARPAFPEWVLAQAAARPEVRVVSDKLACPTWAPDVAERLLPLVAGPTEACGLLHFCHPPGCSWLEWGQRILDVATASGVELQTRRLTPVAIADLHGMAAPRPAYSVMDTGRFAAISGRAAADWTEWLPQMAGKV